MRFGSFQVSGDDRVRIEYNYVRLHEAIGYVPPTTNTSDEENRFERPAGGVSTEPGNNGSTTTAGPTPRRRHD